MIFNGFGSFQNARSRYVQLVQEFSKQIADLESSQERNNDYELWGARYLALHDKIAFLANKRAIPKDLARYFDSNFRAAYALLKEEPFKQYESELTEFTTWIKEHDLKPSVAPKPYGKQ